MSAAGVKLILGAGRRAGHYTTKPGPLDVTIDKAKAAGADIRQDLTQQPLPFPDGHFTEVHFEFFPHAALLAGQGFALQEAVRVTAPGGKIRIDTGRPTTAGELARVRQEIRTMLAAAGFAVTEGSQVQHLQFEALKP